MPTVTPKNERSRETENMLKAYVLQIKKIRKLKEELAELLELKSALKFCIIQNLKNEGNH